MTYQEIIDTVEDVQTIEDDEPSDDDDGVQSEEVQKKPTSKEVRNAMDIIFNYSLFTGNKMVKSLALNLSGNLQKELNKTSKQSTINSFFNID